MSGVCTVCTGQGCVLGRGVYWAGVCTVQGRELCRGSGLCRGCVRCVLDRGVYWAGGCTGQGCVLGRGVYCTGVGTVQGCVLCRGVNCVGVCTVQGCVLCRGVDYRHNASKWLTTEYWTTNRMIK